MEIIKNNPTSSDECLNLDVSSNDGLTTDEAINSDLEREILGETPNVFEIVGTDMAPCDLISDDFKLVSRSKRRRDNLKATKSQGSSEGDGSVKSLLFNNNSHKTSDNSIIFSKVNKSKDSISSVSKKNIKYPIPSSSKVCSESAVVTPKRNSAVLTPPDNNPKKSKLFSDVVVDSNLMIIVNETSIDGSIDNELSEFIQSHIEELMYKCEDFQPRFSGFRVNLGELKIRYFDEKSALYGVA